MYRTLSTARTHVAVEPSFQAGFLRENHRPLSPARQTREARLLAQRALPSDPQPRLLSVTCRPEAAAWAVSRAPLMPQLL